METKKERDFKIESSLSKLAPDLEEFRTLKNFKIFLELLRLHLPTLLEKFHQLQSKIPTSKKKKQPNLERLLNYVSSLDSEVSQQFYAIEYKNLVGTIKSYASHNPPPSIKTFSVEFLRFLRDPQTKTLQNLILAFESTRTTSVEIVDAEEAQGGEEKETEKSLEPGSQNTTPNPEQSASPTPQMNNERPKSIYAPIPQSNLNQFLALTNKIEETRDQLRNQATFHTIGMKAKAAAIDGALSRARSKILKTKDYGNLRGFLDIKVDSSESIYEALNIHRYGCFFSSDHKARSLEEVLDFIENPSNQKTNS